MLFNQQLMDILLSIISGVLLLVIGQVFKKGILSPIQEYKKLKAKTTKLLVYYANCLANPLLADAKCDDSRYLSGADAFRNLAAEVAGFVDIMPWYGFVFYAIPMKCALLKARSALIGLSNSFFLSKGFPRDIHFEIVEEYKMDLEKNMRLTSYKRNQKSRDMCLPCAMARQR